MSQNVRMAAERLIEAVKSLPVEDWVETDFNGQPKLLGYVMQARHEWDEVRNAAHELEMCIDERI